MHEDGWSRFMLTGQVHDYLAYKGHPGMEEAMSMTTVMDRDKAGEIRTHERGNTGFRDADRDCYQGRTDGGVR